MNRTDAFLAYGEEKRHGFLLTLTDLPGLADLVVPSRTGRMRWGAEIQFRLMPRPSLAFPKIRITHPWRAAWDKNNLGGSVMPFEHFRDRTDSNARISETFSVKYINITP
jgi:hypothetical protein